MTGPILIFGSNGQIGTALSMSLPDAWPAVHLTRDGADLEQPSELRRVVRAHSPSVIINAAAYTAVDRAESDRDRCFAVNAEAPAVLADEAARIDALLVHYSTDYVFDGLKRTPYVETDSPSPINVYGESKAMGDRLIGGSGARHLIIRTSWVYSGFRKNFLQTILSAARQREELKVVDDQVGTPTSATLIAHTTVEMLRRARNVGDASGGLGGLYHLSSTGSTTWFEFAREILRTDPRPEEQIVQRVNPITSAEFGSPAARPPYSVLDTQRLRTALGVAFPSWRDELLAVQRQ